MPNYEPVEPETRDHYFELGVYRYATVTQIKKAFHKLALLFRPDKMAPGETIDAIEFRTIGIPSSESPVILN
jgi:DnaJ-class molecular chaperone